MTTEPSNASASGNIGEHIREKVIPAGMSVTKAAKLLGVGRPALSNLLNGNASLSQEMAHRLERAFATDAKKLLEIQAALAARHSVDQFKGEDIKSFVPTFLNITSRDIEDWWKDRISGRSRLAVFLRRLVNTTVDNILHVDFPGNDDSQRPGWDGFTNVRSGNPWVPSGKAGWEFGTNKEPKPKADKDYTKSLSVSEEERAHTTFIFVTTMRWPGKSAWAEQRRLEKNWKDVRAYDASDLEQWLEQSIPGQVWYANETGLISRGTVALHAHWTAWAADCEPTLVRSLFADVVKEGASQKLAKLLNDKKAVTVSADSRGEGLAFIDAALSVEPEFQKLQDRMVIFNEPGVLPSVMARNLKLIPVVASREVEKELAQFKKDLASVTVQPKNISSQEPDFSLSTLSYDAFSAALTEMGFDRDGIDRLAHESGRSITVLRRRLSNTEAIRTPAWSSDNRYARFLAPISLAGSWDSRSRADQDVLQLIARKDHYEEIEQAQLELMDLEDSPVWCVGTYRGVVSKIDALFATAKHLTSEEIERFLEISELVLSEDDPALDLPEADRWMANIYGKKRDISGPLRDGISETLVLLSIHGHELFKDRLGVAPAQRVASLLRNLLVPLSSRKLEVHSHDLPMYAEAAPEEFLNIIEDDLSQEGPATLELIRPASSGLWSSNPRTGLLWALENIAWNPEYFMRVAVVLAQLSEKKLEDNLVNKPINTLGSLFRCWLPQTAAPIGARLSGLKYLAHHHPEVAWEICVEQFDGRHQTVSPNHKPRWRTDARGHGRGVSPQERFEMYRLALDLTLSWTEYNCEMLGDLVRCASSIPVEDQLKLWTLIVEWAKFASEEGKAILRETIRRSVQGLKAESKQEDAIEPIVKAAKRAFDALQPNDAVHKHAWLFTTDWVEWSADEIHGDTEDAIGEARDAHIAEARKKAVAEILTQEGGDGLYRLSQVGEGGFQVGWYGFEAFGSLSEVADFVMDVISAEKLDPKKQKDRLTSGLLHHANAVEAASDLLSKLKDRSRPEEFLKLLRLSPFSEPTWDFIEKHAQELAQEYWRTVPPSFFRGSPDGLNLAMDRLLSADRPRAAFDMVRLNLKSIPPRRLFNILSSYSDSTEEFSGNHMESYSLKEAMKLLNMSGEISVDELAKLEFQFLAVLEREEGAIPNLERQINHSPEMFAQIVSFVFKRSDDQEDPPELRAADDEATKARAEQCYRLLDRLHRIPGRNENDELDGNLLTEWIVTARRFLKAWSRLDVGESEIGQLLAKAPADKDGVWPCEQVRIALEKTISKSMSRGFMIGKFNLRGAHWRGEGGNQERKLASNFESWASSVEFHYPKVAKVLRQMRDRYLADAEREDTDAHIRNRLNH